MVQRRTGRTRPVTHGRSGVGRDVAFADLAPAYDDLVDHAVVLRLLRGEPAIAIRVGLDLLDGLAGVVGDALSHELLDVDHALGLDGDV